MKKRLKNISNLYASKWLVLLFDSLIVIFTFLLAYIIRFNFELAFDFGIFLKQIPIVALTSIICFISLGTHKSVVRYTGIKDIINIVISGNIAATILIIVTYTARKYQLEAYFDLPGSIIYIHLLLNVLFLIGARLLTKSIYLSLMHNDRIQKNVLIYGAGSSGMITYDAITNDPRNDIEVAGFIDDNPKKIGKKINRLTVYELKTVTQAFILKNEIEEIIISIQNIDSSRLLQITSSLFSIGLKVKIVPPVQHWIDGDLSISQIKDVHIEDLLGRTQIEIDNPNLIHEYENQVIAVTGAAGSIGSELVRKLIKYEIKRLVLIDSAESNLYDLQQELIRNNYSKFMVVIADVRDYGRMDKIFNLHKPKIVFHAAAYKHVPLMENAPYEAVSVNIRGTKNIASLSIKHGVLKFILISTDKAVNPTNVMGATKRIAELYISCLKNVGRTKFVITRFGNVLGSSGSVIPLFKRQIETGGPITVTHKEITRFFMTISEACQLVLEAATMGNGGEIYVFDMGKSVKIYDLALNMIILSGLRFPDDIDIKITGLRPGEKIYEELLADGENTIPTYHEKIMIAKTKPFDPALIESKVLELCKNNIQWSNLEIVARLKEIVPEYLSNNSKFEVLDKRTNKL